MFKWRQFVCVVMTGVLPALLVAQDYSSATLRTSGLVYVNGAPAPASSAIFPHDVIQTKSGPDDAARIDADRVRIVMAPDTVLEFDGSEVVLEHGKLQVENASRLNLRAGCLVITPLTEDLTSYDVADTDGNVNVAARKHDVLVHSSTANTKKVKLFQSVIVHEGQQMSSAENCGGGPKAPVSAVGTILNSPEALAIGTGIIGGVLVWILLPGNSPASPAVP
jgi:hypothetical protein